MNITKESEELENLIKEVKGLPNSSPYKLPASLIINRDIEIVGEPERNGDGFTYTFKPISERGWKYLRKQQKSENKRNN